ILITLTQLTGGAQKLPAAVVAPDKVQIVLFSDFQCPFCAQFALPFRELQSRGIAGIQTTVQFKHFPLSIHPASLLAHKAAVAASEQGRFWEMHDLLFANQGAVTRHDLLRYATRLGLDLDRFRKDLDSERARQLIEADFSEGVRLGVQGTPTFLVNGNPYSGTHTLDQLKQIIIQERQRLQAVSEITDSL